MGTDCPGRPEERQDAEQQQVGRNAVDTDELTDTDGIPAENDEAPPTADDQMAEAAMSAWTHP
jgi:hypothetical protein